MIDQDEGDTFTVHQVIDQNADISKIDPYEIIYSILGGTQTPFRIQVDEILVSSAWRPNFCIADDYMSKGGRVFLAGDSGAFLICQSFRFISDNGIKLTVTLHTVDTA
jgi:hypothetical protein